MRHPTHSPPSSKKGGLRTATIVLFTLTAAIVGTCFFLSRPNHRSHNEDRSRAHELGVATGENEKDTWPSTPEGLITEFWQAASQRNYARLVTLCPGSKADDFKIYYDQWTPSPAASLGKPEPHPTNPEVQLYPVQVPFPGFPQKTIKMALGKAPDGRLIIDGALTIWW